MQEFKGIFPLEEQEVEAAPVEEFTPIRALPTYEIYKRLYSNTCGSNEKKAIALFKDYESGDRIRRLKSEMSAVQSGRVLDEDCIRMLGKNKQARFGSFQKYAQMLLAALNGGG